MKHGFLVIIYCISLMFCCCSFQNEKSVHVFIPMNYTGWVNIIYNNPNSTGKPLAFSNGYVYFITKDPQSFKVKDGELPPGRYDMHYYYYDKDTVIELRWLDCPKRNIFFERTIGSKDINHYRSSLYTFTFYVSKELLGVDNLSVDKLPKNKILNQIN